MPSSRIIINSFHGRSCLVRNESGKCEAKIAESTKAVRKLKLRVKAGSERTIDFVPAAGDNALPVHSTSETVELSIMKKGGALRITCADAGTEKAAVVYIE